MAKMVKEIIHAKDIEIGIYTTDFENDYISLTDIARYKSDDPTATIQNWMRNKDIIEFLGLWESLHNADFKPLEFEGFKKEAGANAFTMSPKKWIENSRLSLDWNLHREISKINYRIHTDAIKDNLILPELTPAQTSFTYASEADMLNVILFGMTAKEWRANNAEKHGNIRDDASIDQLLVLANLESYNAVLINQNKTQKDRMILLRELAINQLRTINGLSVSGLPKYN